MDVLNSPFSTLNVSAHDGVLHVALNRMTVLNCVNFEMVLELHAVMDAIEGLRQQKEEKDTFRAMLLEFKGGCVGIDIASADADEKWEYRGIHSQQLLSSLVEKLYHLPLVVVCLADGPVVGLGLGLWLASDLRVATARSTFRCGFSSLGISNCDMGVSWLLPKVAGYQIASRMLLLHDAMSAKEAASCDLTHFVERDYQAGMGRVQGSIAKLKAEHSMQGLLLTKKQLKTSIEGSTSLGQAVMAENAIQTYLLSREDVMTRARKMLAGLKRASKL